MEYKLVLGNTVESLNKYVNELLQDGWTLWGPPLAILTGDEVIKTVYFAQAVIHAQ